MANLRFKLGDYATISTQLVEIIDISVKNHPWYAKSDGSVKATTVRYKVKFVNDTLSHWVDEEFLNVIPEQSAPKVLFGK